MAFVCHYWRWAGRATLPTGASGHVAARVACAAGSHFAVRFACAAGDHFAVRFACAASGWGPAPNTPAKGCALSNPDAMLMYAERLVRMPTCRSGQAAAGYMVWHNRGMQQMQVST